MLKSLFIQNYALIDTLDIRFAPGFSVITGETGAGKSIILGAIGLLLGQRADSRSIKNGANRCVIEATFDLSAYGMELFFEQNDLDFDGKECIVRREITAAGKSRAFINDTPATVNQLKELGEMLIDIHSQHQNLLLNKENFQLQVIDILAGDREEMQQYKTLYTAFRKVRKQLEQAQKEAEQARTEEDYLAFQLDQLEKASLKEGEQEELEQEENELNQGIVNSVAGWISQFIFGIITICVFIVVIIPIIIYIIVCIILGKEPSVRIRNPKKIFKKKDAR